MDKGILYGISTGPGDPELMTLKAVRILENVSVVATPRTRSGNAIAYDIASGVVDLSKKEVVYLEFPMSLDSDILQSNYKMQAAKIIDYLSKGVDVAMLNIGDASLYSTFSYVRDEVVSAGFESITVPGVNSFSASAGTLGISLTKSSLPMTVVPGRYKDIKSIIISPGTKVVMKPASEIGNIIKLLEEQNMLGQAYAVCNCGMPDEKVYQDITKLPLQGDYFVTIIILV